MQIINVDA